MPYCGWIRESGRQFDAGEELVEVEPAEQQTGAPSRKTKKKIAKTKKIALQPHRRMIASIAGSARRLRREATG